MALAAQLDVVYISVPSTHTNSKSHRSPSFASSFEEDSVKIPLVAHLRGKTGPEPLGPLQASLTWQSLNFLWHLVSSFIEFFKNCITFFFSLHERVCLRRPEGIL